jgi:hypothetical protein
VRAARKTGLFELFAITAIQGAESPPAAAGAPNRARRRDAQQAKPPEGENARSIGFMIVISRCYGCQAGRRRR